MATPTTPLEELASSIAQEIEALQTRDQTILDAIIQRANQAHEEAVKRGVRPLIGLHPTPEEQAERKSLSLRIERLKQVQTWMAEDHLLERVIDEAIGNHIRAAEKRQLATFKITQRRQNVFAISISVAALIVGWLLSAVTPATFLAHLFSH